MIQESTGPVLKLLYAENELSILHKQFVMR